MDYPAFGKKHSQLGTGWGDEHISSPVSKEFEKSPKPEAKPGTVSLEMYLALKDRLNAEMQISAYRQVQINVLTDRLKQSDMFFATLGQLLEKHLPEQSINEGMG
jgi:hypothetical protein